MKILQINNKAVNPPADGGARLVLNQTLGLLATGNDVRFLTINASRNHIPPEAMPPDYVRQVRFGAVPLDTSLRMLPACIALLRGKSYHVSRFESREFQKLLDDALRADEYDIVELEHTFMGAYLPLIRRLSKAKIVLRPQNAEFRIWEKLAAGENNPAKRWYLKQAAASLKKFEAQLLRNVDGVLPLTHTDARIFSSTGCTLPMRVVPMGWDFSASEKNYVPPVTGTAVPYHLAAMDWLPNEEAMRWFLNDIWPLIHAQHPDVVFHCAGRKMPDWITRGNFLNVAVTGEVNEPFAYVADKNVMVVPLRSGSGIRAKILEAMALGKTVISTLLGADGIGGKHGEHFLLAETPEQFAQAFSLCMTNPEERVRIGLAGRGHIMKHFSIEVCGKACTEFYHELTGGKP